MFFKKKRKIMSSESEEISKICATCKFATPMNAVDDFLCSKKGLVSPDYSCKKYFLNHLVKRPPKKRTLNTSRLSPKDFEI